MSMSEEAPRNIISRRNRPAKAPLSRDVIVSTALHILKQDGFSGLSLRRVATALDTGAASLYVYVANLDELHSLMLDQALGAVVKLPEVRSSLWQDRLKALLLSYFHVLYERQGLAQLAMSTIASGPNSLRIWERLLGLLKEGGVEDIKAAWGADLLTLYVTAIAAEQSLRRESGQVLRRVENALSAVSAKEFPLVFASKEALLYGEGNLRSEWALDVILDGIVCGQLPLRTPRDPSGNSRARGGQGKK
jgi:AcrR family transcriptional regulator